MTLRETMNRRQLMALCLAIGTIGGCVRLPSVLPNVKRAPGWAAASGRHYQIGSEGGQRLSREGRPLYKTIREPAVHGRAGLSRDVTSRSPAERPDDATAIEGPFSGETRYFDFGSVEREGSMAAKVANNTGRGHAGLLVIDGNPDRLRTDVAYFKDAVYAAAKFFNTGAFEDQPLTCWEVGNEPNDISYFNPRDIEIGEDESVWDYFNDEKQAALYVDLLLAPAVEALRRAERDLSPAFRPPGPFTVMNGGIGLINVPDSHDWLKQVLEREPSAARAPTLADAPMKKHLDVIAVHYAFQLPYNLGEHDYNWKKSLTSLYEQWVETGDVDGIWHTEEGGYEGGANQLAFAMPRFLDWWTEKNWTVDRGRLIWWPSAGGADVDSRAAERLQAMLVDLWNGRDRLANVSDQLALTGDGAVDGYAFTTADDALHLAVFVDDRSRNEDDSGSAELSKFQIEGIPCPPNPNAYATSAYVVESERLRSVSVEMGSARSRSDDVRFDHRSVTLSPSETFVVLVSPPSERPARAE